jgi:hypothetical protein
MTKVEKLNAMEALWQDLSRHAEQFESPDWHEEVLNERDLRVATGQESPADWNTAKKILCNQQQ